MTTFAEKNVTYSDGQVNVMPLPEAIMANGFIPETRDAPGMPLAAQHLNWLFRDLYRRINERQTASNKDTLPTGTPIPCPSVNLPEGYLKCNGAAFDMDKYPGLAKAYPNGIIPDLRGEFILGWDDGRGVDQGRNILSTQKIRVFRVNEELGIKDPEVPEIQVDPQNPEGPLRPQLDYPRLKSISRSSSDTMYGGELLNTAFLYIVKAE